MATSVAGEATKGQGPWQRVEPLNLTLTAAEIQSTVTEISTRLSSDIDGIVAAVTSTESPSFDATFGRLDAALAEAALASSQATLPSLVAGDANADAVKASSEAKSQLQKIFDGVFRRSDLYAALKRCSPAEADADPARSLYRGRVMDGFKRNGVELDTETRSAIEGLDAEISECAVQFEFNLNQDTTAVALTPEELAGLPESFVSALPKAEDAPGKVLVDMKAPIRIPVMRQATNAETRRRIEHASQNRAVDTNTSLLVKLVELRHQRAVTLGYSSHAEYMLAPKMAGTPERVTEFSNDIANKLAKTHSAELEMLAGLKKAAGDDTPLRSHDIAFFSRVAKEAQHSLNDSFIQEHFPLDHVVTAVLDIYRDLFGLKFQELQTSGESEITAEDAAVPAKWHEDVRVFAVRDAKTDELVGHFFLDLFSRPGKFGHQCVVPIAPSFLRADGSRVTPICAILGNMTKATAERPSLLRHAEVSTLFHELGHVFHAVLTKVDYSIFSWTWPMMPWRGGVEQDYLEVPSMALEQFTYRVDVLSRLSKHYQTGVPLDEGLIARMSAAKFFLSAMGHRRFLALSTFDMAIHSGAAPYKWGDNEGLDIHGLWVAIHTDLAGYPPADDTFMPATWYHMIIGYDAGYFGYLWSEVYAYDVLEPFEKHSLDGDAAGPAALNALGLRFRKCLLEPCASVPATKMLENFLGRAPSDSAWIAKVVAE